MGRGRRRVLGRGLDALLPAGHVGLREVPVDRIESNPAQPRQYFDHKTLDDLAESLRAHGVVQPLVVSALGDDRYRLIVGERRWQAARLAGLEHVPVLVKEVTDRQTLEIALVENVQRQDLNPLEEAAAYQRLITDFGLTQAEVARQVGRSRVAVANTLRLLSLPPTLTEAVIKGRLSEGHARALLALPDSESQEAVMQRVLRDDLTVRATEALVRRLLEGSQSRTRSPRNPDLEDVENRLRRALGTRVSLQPRRQGGRIIIEYGSDEEFDTLFDRLTSQD